jgi:uncharacterized protein YjbI with pentapeptide repeats
MANPEHVAILKRGVAEWNAWREEHPEVQPDLVRAKLSNADLRKADLTQAAMGAADLDWANLAGANLSRANLTFAKLEGANLSKAMLSEANLRWANLSRAILVESCLSNADLTESYVYGVSVWNVGLANTVQKSLIVTPEYESVIQVGPNLAKAQISAK